MEICYDRRKAVATDALDEKYQMRHRQGMRGKWLDLYKKILGIFQIAYAILMSVFGGYRCVVLLFMGKTLCMSADILQIIQAVATFVIGVALCVLGEKLSGGYYATDESCEEKKTSQAIGNAKEVWILVLNVTFICLTLLAGYFIYSGALFGLLFFRVYTPLLPSFAIVVMTGVLLYVKNRRERS